jgi:hypothetical protein
MDEVLQLYDLRRANYHPREAVASMPNDPQRRPRGRVDRTFLVVVVLLIATWALFVGSAVLLFGVR